MAPVRSARVNVECWPCNKHCPTWGRPPLLWEVGYRGRPFCQISSWLASYSKQFTIIIIMICDSALPFLACLWLYPDLKVSLYSSRYFWLAISKSIFFLHAGGGASIPLDKMLILTWSKNKSKFSLLIDFRLSMSSCFPKVLENTFVPLNWYTEWGRNQKERGKGQSCLLSTF